MVGLFDVVYELMPLHHQEVKSLCRIGDVARMGGSQIVGVVSGLCVELECGHGSLCWSNTGIVYLGNHVKRQLGSIGFGM